MLQAHRRGLENFEVTVTNVSQPNNTPQETAVQAFLAENQGAGAEVIPFEADGKVLAEKTYAEYVQYADYFRSKARQQLMKDLAGGDDEFTQKNNELLGFTTSDFEIVYLNVVGSELVSRDGQEYKEVIAKIRCGEGFWQAFDEESNRPIRLYKKPRNDAELKQVLQSRGITADLKLEDFKWRYMLYFDMPQQEEAEDAGVKVYAINMSPTSGINFKNSYIKQLTRKRTMVTDVLTRITVSKQKKDKMNFHRLEFEALDMEGKPLGVKTDGVK